MNGGENNRSWVRKANSHRIVEKSLWQIEAAVQSPKLQPVGIKSLPLLNMNELVSNICLFFVLLYTDTPAPFLSQGQRNLCVIFLIFPKSREISVSFFSSNGEIRIVRLRFICMNSHILAAKKLL
jgi:hypothetical protein